MNRLAARMSLCTPLSLFLTACTPTSIDGFSASEWAVIDTLSPLPDVPPDPTNRYADDPAAAAFGQSLFFERRYSGPIVTGDDGTNGGLGAVGETGAVACVDCHDPSAGFSDHRSFPPNTSLGVDWGTRNSPTLLNVAYNRWWGHAGKQDTLWTQATLSPEDPVGNGSNRCAYVHAIWDHYRDVYDAIFMDTPLPSALDPSAPDAARFPASCKPKANASDPDGAWEAMAPEDRRAVMQILANCGKAVAAYERRLVSRNAPFDRYVAGDLDAISESVKRGLRLFIGRAACVTCHSGPHFTDGDFHNIGVAQVGEHVPAEDVGRHGDLPKVLAHPFNGASEWSDDPSVGAARLDALEPDLSDVGAFRTEALRGVAETAPYFHNGRAATLRDAVELYVRGGDPDGFAGTRDPRIVPLDLSNEDVDDLVAFLESLTGEPVPDHLTLDTSAP